MAPPTTFYSSLPTVAKVHNQQVSAAPNGRNSRPNASTVARAGSRVALAHALSRKLLDTFVFIEELGKRYGDGADSVVKVRTIAAHFGISERQTQRRIRQLEVAGWLTQRRRHRSGREVASLYELHRPEQFSRRCSPRRDQPKRRSEPKPPRSRPTPSRRMAAENVTPEMSPRYSLREDSQSLRESERTRRPSSGVVDQPAATPPLVSAEVQNWERERSANREELSKLEEYFRDDIDQGAKSAILRELTRRGLPVGEYLALFAQLLRRVRPDNVAALAIHFARNPVLYRRQPTQVAMTVATTWGSPAQAAPKTLLGTPTVREYIRARAAEIRKHAGFEAIAEQLDRLGTNLAEPLDLENLDKRLIALEGETIAIARTRQSVEELTQARAQLDLNLRPYRGKMTAAQLAELETQFLERCLLDCVGLPRLSLFYCQLEV